MHRILVVSNATVEVGALQETIRAHADADVEVLVVAPALNSRLRHWTSDEDRAREDALSRLGTSLDRLHGAGIRAYGRVADADPLQAMADWSGFFRPHEIVVATPTDGRSNWLARNVVGRARARFPVPVVCVPAA